MILTFSATVSRLLPLALSMSLALGAFAQTRDLAPLGKPGQYSLAWFEDNPYAGDSSVHAYVITARARALVTDDPAGGYEIKTRHRRIARVLDRQGTDYATVSVDVYAPERSRTTESVSEIAAFTYRRGAGGVEVIPVGEDQIFRTRVNQYRERYTFSFPAVDDGAVLDLNYVVTSDYIARLDKHFFQEDIPVREAQLQLQSPGRFAYQASFFGAHPLLTSNETDDGRTGGAGYTREEGSGTMTLQAFDVPAIRPEPYLTTVDNYRTHAVLELLQYRDVSGNVRDRATSWEAIGNELREQRGYRDAMKPAKAYREWAERYDAGAEGAGGLLARYDWAFAEVTRALRFRGYMSTYAEGSPRKLLDVGEGNSAAVNYALVGLCRALGLEAAPVYLSTREYGLLYEAAPSRSSLVHTICAVRDGDDYVFADATVAASAPGLLPVPDLNYHGLLVAEDDASFVDLQTGALGARQLAAQLAVGEDGYVSGAATLTLMAHELADHLKVVEGAVAFDEEDFDPFPGYDFTIEEVREGRRLTAEVVGRVRSEQPLAGIDGVLGFGPGIDAPLKKNPFAAPARAYPVEFPYGVIHNRRVSVALPEGYTVESVPEPVMAQTPDRKIAYRYTAEVGDGNVLVVATMLQVRRLVLSGDDYGALRQVFEIASAKEQEQVALKPSRS